MYSDDERTCLQVLARGSKSFNAAGHLLPRRVRGAFAALYAFCRGADDEVDEARSPTEGLHRLTVRVDAVYRDAPADGPIDRAFTQTVRDFAIPRTIVDAMLEGFRWDVDGREYADIEDVLDYCARVASTVGVMTTLVMGPRERHVLARACDLGAAMQLTNICRDVGEDARRGRVYLPTRWLGREGIDASSLRGDPRHSAPLGRVVRRVLDVADVLYRRAEHGVPLLPRDCRLAIMAAREIYAAIGDEIRGNGYDSVSRRATTSRRRKALLLGGATRALLPRRDFRAEHAFAEPLDATRFLIDSIRTSR